MIEIAPCGVICGECARFPSLCGGCAAIAGKAYWTEYAGAERCAVYECCVIEKKRGNCGGCESLPCTRFTKDPSVSDEINAAHLKKMLSNLEKASTQRR